MTKGTPTFRFTAEDGQIHGVPGRSVSVMSFCNLTITFVIVTIEVTAEPAIAVCFCRKSDMYSPSVSQSCQIDLFISLFLK